MDKRLLKLYNQELTHLRESAAEFSREYPKIAGRLALDGVEACPDPYVERLLEGFAFMAARVQLKLDSEFPRFTQSLLDTVFPHYLAPTPSMATVQFQPDLADSGLAEGFVVPRGTMLRSILGRGERTPCEYRTAHEVSLWPIEISEAQYHTLDLASLGLPARAKAKAAIRVRLRCTAGATFADLSLDNLHLHLRGAGELPMRLYEQIVGHGTSIVVRPITNPAPWQEVLGAEHIRRVGFDPEDALLPFRSRSFDGYRMLHEYFAFPSRYMYVELSGLSGGVRQCDATELDIVIMLDADDLELENAFDESNFALFCTPAVNLIKRRTDRIDVTDRSPEFRVVVDRTRPQDHEVFHVLNVVGHGTRGGDREFKSFYAATDTERGEGAYYTLNRRARLLSEKERRSGPRSSYAGSEMFISLVDAQEAPYSEDLRELSLSVLCTNRDLPLHMPVGRGQTDFTLEINAPVQAVRCLGAPSVPRASSAEGDVVWRLISHLTLNYLSLTDTDARSGAAGLRDLLRLYGDLAEAHVRRQIDGVKSMDSRPIMRRVSVSGPIAFARGLEVGVTLEESAFEGSGVFLLGAVLEQFFANYVSINSFTETVISTVDRGEVMRWPPRIGQRHNL